ncbi:P-loop containing nucleoside triphosphate hydrolase protein [Basidiobolus meristosporus CBS 931.73]|uniref:p-loop containing nucleoside triphosphate hydrolase protein n=1 Tax=Basidiobolus meristosporus CBS 931.73 TaxID=1314790 RepID=A0A1Y1XVP0_9FUNG|nr:P-loop containing nucleoside triphosphate hydrolase protein [Basidiobolus meristosporus CBS 931.73]|eukprot:ORX89817.1 P-loop containing nucleoside triphosphate hydrolase protein [Basidiobolus meristosporus CBS 931.73]
MTPPNLPQYVGAPNPGIVIDQGIPDDVWSQGLQPNFTAVQPNTTQAPPLTFNRYESIKQLIQTRDKLDKDAYNLGISDSNQVSEIGFELNQVNNGASQFSFGYTLFYQSNQFAQRSIPYLFSNMEAAAQSAYNRPPGNILMNTVTFKTLPSTALENTDSGPEIIPIVVTYAMSFILLFYVTTMVRDREEGQKQLLILAGLDSRAYYLAAFIRDYIIFLIPCAVFLIVLKAEGTPMFVDSSPAGYILLLILSGPPYILMAYLLSFIFTRSRAVGLVMGFIMLILVFVPYAIIRFGCNNHISITAAAILSFFIPVIALQRGLAELALAWTIGYPYSASMVFSFHFPILPIFLALIASTVLYGSLVLSVEILMNANQTPMKLIRSLFEKKTPGGPANTGDRMETRVEMQNVNVDEEVSNEKQRILGSQQSIDTMHVCGLSKEFPLQYSNRRRVIIDELWLTLRRNECLGYLGPNGAGKTTTIKMLVGALTPSSGNAYIEGHSISPYSRELQRIVGVCQQFDVLFPDLTGREHLQLFARLRGVENVQVAVDEIVEQMQLRNVADQKAKGYSGGNKRRLSIGMAAIGHPKILFLDEPTTGVDVHVRQSIWKAIRNLKKNTSIVLTTHSMEEADALCDRIGITVNSRLAALGTAQRLKNVYGKGYKINLKTKTMSTVDQVIHAIFRQFDTGHSQVRLLRKLGCNLELEVEGSTLGKLFGYLQEIKEPYEIVDYAVAQTTLAQVFVEFAKQQGMEN